MAKSEKNWIYKCKFAKYALFSNFLGGAKALEIWKKHAYFFQISIFPTGGKYCWKFGKTGLFFPNFYTSNGREINIVGNLEKWKFFTSLDHAGFWEGYFI